jgi:hypothetical protein
MQLSGGLWGYKSTFNTFGFFKGKESNSASKKPAIELLMAGRG